MLDVIVIYFLKITKRLSVGIYDRNALQRHVGYPHVLAWETRRGIFVLTGLPQSLGTAKFATIPCA